MCVRARARHGRPRGQRNLAYQNYNYENVPSNLAKKQKEQKQNKIKTKTKQKSKKGNNDNKNNAPNERWDLVLKFPSNLDIKRRHWPQCHHVISSVWTGNWVRVVLTCFCPRIDTQSCLDGSFSCGQEKRTVTARKGKFTRSTDKPPRVHVIHRKKCVVRKHKHRLCLTELVFVTSGSQRSGISFMDHVSMH